MFRRLILPAIVISVVSIAAAVAWSASPPSIISYQGKVLVSGSPASTTLPIAFTLYDHPTIGTALYTASGTPGSPTTIEVTPINGLFTINLGDNSTNPINSDIFKNNEQLYLQVTINGEPLTPRKRITASPYALNSKYLDGNIATSTPTTTNYIPVSDASGNFSFNDVTSTNLFVTGNAMINSTTTLPGGIWGSDGKVGIGTTTFSSEFLGGPIGTYVPRFSLQQPTAELSGISMYAASGTILSILGGLPDGVGLLTLYNNSQTVGSPATMLRANETSYMASSSLFIGGNENIGSDKLRVAGDINITNGGLLKFDGVSGTPGYVLIVSTTTGLQEWAPTSSLGITGGGGGSLPSGSDGQTLYYNGAWQATDVFKISSTLFSVAAGYQTSASGLYSMVGGGYLNNATGIYSSVVGGRWNTSTANYSSVVGGYWNTASGNSAFIGGGNDNEATDSSAVVVGGHDNISNGQNAFIGAGEYNMISVGHSSFIGAGRNNYISQTDSFIGAGRYNNISQTRSFIGSGEYNRITQSYSFIGGGQSNAVTQQWATVVGGLNNTSSGQYSFIGGGRNNTASGTFSSIIGSYNNATGNSSFVMGVNNTVSGIASIGLGRLLTINGDYTFGVNVSSTIAPNGSVTIDRSNVIVLTGGNVGVRTTTPDYPLTVQGDINFTGGLRQNGSLISFGGGGSPGGLDGEIQYNDSGSFGATSSFFWDKANERLGIGTSSPSFKLTLENDGGILALGNGDGFLNQQGEIISVTGTGTRMIWYPRKGAFRAGGILDPSMLTFPSNDTDQWDDSNIGALSFAANLDNIAFGGGSAAFGILNKALGDSSFVGGANNTSSGFASLAFGLSNISSATSSAVFGTANEASGERSFAIGYLNTASGDSSFVGGTYSSAIGEDSFAFGQYAIASGARSLALGSYTQAATQSVAIGSGSVLNPTWASGLQSVSIGSPSQASGYQAIAIGYGAGGHATGSIALGNVGVREGANYSIGFNASSTVTNMYTPNVIALMGGNVGVGTTSPDYKLNIFGTTGQNLLNISTSTNSRIFAVNSNGNVGIGTSTPVSKLTLDNDGGILAIGAYNVGNATVPSGAGTRMLWYPRKSAFRVGRVGMVSAGTEWDNANIGGYSAVVGGWDNRASSESSFIGGGVSNWVSGTNAVILGGGSNVASGDSSFVGSGIVNRASATYSSVIGGQWNTASGYSSFIGGGIYNTSSNNYSVVLGGSHNTASGEFSFVGNGFYNRASGINSSVFGSRMTVSGQYSFGLNLDDTTRSVSSNNTMAIMGGKVGIGTETPSSSLHINNGSFLITGSTGATPVSGAGTRLMWVPDKTAFRAGQVSGDYWDSANMGNYSVSFGYNNRVEGEHSFSFGSNNNVTGTYSFAGGTGNKLFGYKSFMFGSNNYLNDDFSTIFGINNTSTGGYGFISGGANEISGTFSFIGGGTQNTITGQDSTIMGGTSNVITGRTSFIGAAVTGTVSGDYSFIAGGTENNIISNYSFIGGGQNNMVSGTYSFIGGGQNNIVSGTYASFVAGGSSNFISGVRSFIGAGDESQVTGAGSVAFGRRMIVNGDRSFGISLGIAGDTIDENNVMAIVGGSVGIGTTTPSTTLFVEGTAGGSSAWVNYSDERLKTNIITIENALSKVLSLRGVNYEWKNPENDFPGVKIGLIAQEVKEIVPEVVNEIGGVYGIQYAPLAALLVEAVKDQQAQIDALKNATTTLNIQEGTSGIIYLVGQGFSLQNQSLLNVVSINGAENKWEINQDGLLISRVATSQGEKSVYGLTSEEIEITLSGNNQLINGEAAITFNSAVQEMIDDSRPMKVSITLTSDEPVITFVKEKSATGFTVKQTGNGMSNATFDWIVIAKRKFIDPFAEEIVAENGSEESATEILDETETTTSTEEIAEDINEDIPLEEETTEPVVEENPVEEEIQTEDPIVEEAPASDLETETESSETSSENPVE